MKTLRLLLPLLAVMMLAGCMGCGSEERMAAAGKLDAKCPIKVGDSLTLVGAHFSPTYAMVFDFEGTTNLPEEPSMAQTRAFVQAIRTVPEIDSLLAFVRQGRGRHDTRGRERHHESREAGCLHEPHERAI